MPPLPTLFLAAILAFYFAWNLGANDVANSMGTSVGSKALTLRQALWVAGILEFTGAVLLGQNVSRTLVTDIVNPAVFAADPQIFLVGMVAALLAAGVWLNLATARGWPVSSSHAVVGAIAGFGWIAAGTNTVAWKFLGLISFTWLITPILSAAIAASLYSLLRYWILQQPEPWRQLNEWIPWLSVSLFGVFGAITLPALARLPLFSGTIMGSFPLHDLWLGLIGIAAFSLTFTTWQQIGSNLHALETQPFQATPVEQTFSRFQIISACFVAFAHGSNDVGNAIAPVGAIAHILQTHTVPTATFNVPIWTLLLGATGIVSGLAVWGWRVITTVGEDITALQPSSGFCAEFATAITVLLASRLGLPVSTSHALVGAVVGIGLLQTHTQLQYKTLQGIGFAWFVTIPTAGLLTMLLFQVALALIE